MVEWPEVICHWNPMLVASPLQQHGDGPILFVNVRKCHAENAMTACERTPVADSLPRAIQERQDGFVSPGGGRINELLRQCWINLPWNVSWNTPAQLASLPAPGYVTTWHPMGIHVVRWTRWNRISSMHPASNATLRIPLDIVRKERG